MEKTMNQNEKLTAEEKKILKTQIKESWNELPQELKELIVELKRQKLKSLYMLQDWAKKNNHETMLDLLSRCIAHKEAKIKEMEEHIA